MLTSQFMSSIFMGIDDQGSENSLVLNNCNLTHIFLGSVYMYNIFWTLNLVKDFVDSYFTCTCLDGVLFAKVLRSKLFQHISSEVSMDFKLENSWHFHMNPCWHSNFRNWTINLSGTWTPHSCDKFEGQSETLLLQVAQVSSPLFLWILAGSIDSCFQADSK